MYAYKKYFSIERESGHMKKVEKHCTLEHRPRFTFRSAIPLLRPDNNKHKPWLCVHFNTNIRMHAHGKPQTARSRVAETAQILYPPRPPTKKVLGPRFRRFSEKLTHPRRRHAEDVTWPQPSARPAGVCFGALVTHSRAEPVSMLSCSSASSAVFARDFFEFLNRVGDFWLQSAVLAQCRCLHHDAELLQHDGIAGFAGHAADTAVAEFRWVFDFLVFAWVLIFVRFLEGNAVKSRPIWDLPLPWLLIWF